MTSYPRTEKQRIPRLLRAGTQRWLPTRRSSNHVTIRGFRDNLTVAEGVQRASLTLYMPDYPVAHDAPVDYIPWMPVWSMNGGTVRAHIPLAALAPILRPEYSSGQGCGMCAVGNTDLVWARIWAECSAGIGCRGTARYFWVGMTPEQMSFSWWLTSGDHVLLAEVATAEALEARCGPTPTAAIKEDASVTVSVGVEL